MELTKEILESRINGLLEAKDKAEKNDSMKPIVPMLDAQMEKARQQLEQLQQVGSEKKNEQQRATVGASNTPSGTNAQNATSQDDPTSLEKLINNDDISINDRDSVNTSYEYEELEKKKFSIIDDYDEFSDKKKAIYRHIRDWVNRKTIATEAQKKKKRSVMLIEFTNIENFLKAKARPDYIDDIINTEYKISFGKIEKAKKGEPIEQVEKRNAKKKNTFTLNYEDMMKKYFS